MMPDSKKTLAAQCGVSTDEEACELMKTGYREMGMMNTILSEEGFSGYAEYLDNYEKLLAESE